MVEMKSREEKISEQKSAIEEYLKAYNEFNIDGMLRLVHPEVVFKNIAGGRVNATANGVDELRRLTTTTLSLFSSRCQTITDFSTAGTVATVKVDFEGTLSTDLTNGMKKGELVKVKGRSKYQFRDGKIFRVTDYG